MMNKKERIAAKVAQDKQLLKALKEMYSYSDPIEAFIEAGERYIKAIKQGRVICSIGSVSASGMSRTIKFLECQNNKALGRHQYLNFYAFFSVLGFEKARNLDGYFRIHGCGMDMIFHTNYSIMHRLQRLGFISRKQCDSLAQDTPSVI